MTSNLVRTARRLALTVAVAGIASVAVAPAAFASPTSMPTTSNFVISPVVGDKVKVPFFCEVSSDKVSDKVSKDDKDDKATKQHNNCIDVQTASRF
jgi:NAD(P)-dependent dehydrogenase (short-subunit alcohol dehydrogenase family)